MNREKATVLVADDDWSFVKMLKVNLEWSNFKVIVAYDGDSAMDKIARLKPNLVILDLMMPKIDGFTLNQELQDEEVTSKIPIIIITGHGDLKRLFKSTKQTRVAAWFDKSSFDITDLVKKVEQMTKSKPQKHKVRAKDIFCDRGR